MSKAETIKAGLENGAELSSFGVITSVETNLTREAFIDGTPRDMVQQVFTLDPGQAAVIEAEASVFVAHLSDVIAADLADPELADLIERVRQDSLQAISRDALTAFTSALEQEAGININSTALTHLQSQFP